MRPTAAASLMAALLLGGGAAGQETAAGAEPPDEVRDVTRVSAIRPDDQRLAGAVCMPKPGANGPWPFDQDAVWKAVEDAVHYMRDKQLPLQFVAIRVGDNGIRNDHRDKIPQTLRFRSPRDEDGISSGGTGRVEPPYSDPEWWHGAEVAYLALGGAAFWSSPSRSTELGERIKVTFARLFDVGGGNTVRFRDGMLNESLEAWVPRPAVVNFSIGSPTRFPGFDVALRAAVNHRQVVVVAAGNEAHSLSEDASYPALYARDHPLVVVVGAHDRGGLLLGASNRGREYVHLLAPGCGLAPVTNDTGMSHLGGTSFAAPLVSFTAAMLLSLTPHSDRQSEEVRERLRVTARRPAPENEADVFYGILDVPAALRLYDDVLRLNDDTLLHGEWAHEGKRDEQTLGTLCREKKGRERDWSKIGLDRVARVRVHRKGERVRLRLLIRELSTSRLPFWEDDCEPLESLNFTFRSDGEQARVWPWDKVADLVPVRNLEDRRPVRPVIVFGAPIPTKPVSASSLLLSVDARDALVRRGLAPKDPTSAQQSAAIKAFQATRREAVTGVLTRTQARDLNRLPTRD